MKLLNFARHIPVLILYAVNHNSMITYISEENQYVGEVSEVQPSKPQLNDYLYL